MHPGISPSILAELTDCNTALSQQRKKRQVLFMLLFIALIWLVSHAEASTSATVCPYTFSLVKVLVRFKCPQSMYLTSYDCSLFRYPPLWLLLMLWRGILRYPVILSIKQASQEFCRLIFIMKGYVFFFLTLISAQALLPYQTSDKEFITQDRVVLSFDANIF